MIRDFALLPTPANARRLLQFGAFGLIDLPAGLERIAAQDCVTESDFDGIICPITPTRRRAAQWLLDSNMRGIVQAHYHPDLHELALLNIAKIAKVAKLTILTRRFVEWRQAANALFFSDVDICTPYDLDGDWIEARRDGLLIVDICPLGRRCAACIATIGREFPQLIVYQSRECRNDSLLPWPVLAGELFPTMPPPESLKAAAMPKHWHGKDILEFAPFYNVCIFPELLS